MNYDHLKWEAARYAGKATKAISTPVEDAFIAGARYAQGNRWHELDEKPEPYADIVYLGLNDRASDNEIKTGYYEAEYVDDDKGERHYTGEGTFYTYNGENMCEEFTYWAYADDLYPQSGFNWNE